MPFAGIFTVHRGVTQTHKYTVRNRCSLYTLQQAVQMQPAATYDEMLWCGFCVPAVYCRLQLILWLPAAMNTVRDI